MAENTFFHEIHQELDAKLVPCGKWKLPLFYPGGAIAEHRNCREKAALFDLTGTEIFQTAGKDAGKALSKIFADPCADLPVGGVMRSFMLRENGNFAAFFTLCRMQQDDFMLHLDRNTPEKDKSYLLDKIKSAGLEVRDLSSAMAILTLAGPDAARILQEAGAEVLPEKEHWQMSAVTDEDGDTFRCIVVARERFGETAFDLCVNADNAVEFYGAIYRINGVCPAGIAAWESLHLESGVPQVPGELHSGVSPERSADLVILEAPRHAALPGTVVKAQGGIPVGVITSGAYCPAAGKARMFCRIEPSVAGEELRGLSVLINGKETAVELANAEISLK